MVRASIIHTLIIAMRILISGAGIAGPTLAYWLDRYGFTPTLIETAPRLRTGGYIIDFWVQASTSRTAWACCLRFAGRDTSFRKCES